MRTSLRGAPSAPSGRAGRAGGSARAAAVVAIAFAAVMLGGAVAACGASSNAVTPADAGGPDASVADGNAEEADAAADAAPDLLAPPPISRTQGEGQLAPQRGACAFEAGAWPAQTLGTEDPVGADIPINHVVVIVQENRSFDHYLGRLVAQGYYKAGDFGPVVSGGATAEAGAGDAGEAGTGDDGGAGDASPAGDAGADALPSGFAHSDQVDVEPPGWANPDGDGGLVTPHPDNEYCYGVDHSWAGQHFDYDDGKMDGFVRWNNPDGQRTFFYEDDTVIPFYYALASTFSVGDRYFCSVLSSTWPNRLFLMAGTSFGIGDNSFVSADIAAHPVAHLFSMLDAAGRTWKDYTDGPHQISFFPYYGFQKTTFPHLRNVKCDLFADIKNGTLPDVSFVMGDEIDETSDEGPSALPGIGGQLVEQLIQALFASPSWKDTAVFITYDENGGIADHVPPARACEPDSYAPHDVNDKSLPGKFDTTGFRVPFLVVSPYARKHFVSHTVHDHTSITRFIEARFGLPALTARDANSTPPYEMFDFENPPFVTPPTITAHTTVPPAVLAQCKQSYVPTCN
jgi:phospholipase C